MRTQRAWAVGVWGAVLLSLARCGGDPTLIGQNNSVDAGMDSGSGAESSAGGSRNNNLPDGVAFGGNENNSSGGDSACGTDCGGGTSVLIGCGNGELDEDELCDDGNTKPGDGCNGICALEPFYECPDPGEKCVSTIVCGDSQVEGAETCDDGDDEPTDGCDQDCQVEPGFGCGDPGEDCFPVETAQCNNGIVEYPETCDDGGTLPDDGCDPECNKDPNYTCPQPGELCQPIVYCGDGVVNQDSEDCDDHNPDPGDGCTGLCHIEPYYDCPPLGGSCQTQIVCGDLEVIGDEACDDGNEEDEDGCAADCKSTEPGWTCPTSAGVGGPCIEAPNPICGDSVLDYGEYCDDGNFNPNDGCTDECEVTAGYTCPSVGSCTLLKWCGDGLANGVVEDCDDGSECDNGDDCTDDPDVCGDDSCAPRGSDGCTATCITETNFICPEFGSPCISTVVCGDGKVTGSETCDDQNLVDTDGCDACQIQDGWECPAGADCRAKECGDGWAVDLEECDDGDNSNNDGCSSTCELEEGFKCEGQDPQLCSATDCGDGDVEGTEQCDEPDNNLGDGCSTECKLEPSCVDASGNRKACSSACGDGMVFPGEECDDGNNRNNDGCDEDCNEEEGYECSVSSDVPDSIVLPIVYRDFQEGPPYNNAGHVDFEWWWYQWHPHFTAGWNGGLYSTKNTPYSNTKYGIAYPYSEMVAGMARATLGNNADGVGLLGRPIFAYQAADVNLDGLADNCPLVASTSGTNSLWRGTTDYNYFCVRYTHGADTFHQWYADVDGVNESIRKQITLTNTAANTFVFDSDIDMPGGFFPIDADAYGVTTQPNLVRDGNGATDDAPTCSGQHNFGFTSEVRYWFQHVASSNAVLTFRGDDDVWVFINGKLAFDLGGLHSRLEGSVNVSTGAWEIWNRHNLADTMDDTLVSSGTVSLGLVDGAIYEIAVFQAERAGCDSNYRLEFKNFLLKRSECVPDCGDGIVTHGEACDLGEDDNTGDYGTCNDDCSLPPRCGDHVTQQADDEECDDGFNLATYGGTQEKCGPGCQIAAYCGDENIDGADGEECDEGDNNQAPGSAYNGCTTSCKLGPYCGDGFETDGEECDDGNLNGTSGSDCEISCTFKCGNAMPDPGEQCDDGDDDNNGGYGECKTNCTFGPYCGDGIKQTTGGANEQCDDGLNDGSYGTCAPGCQFGPRCGDGTTQDTAGEQCDDAGSNVNPVSGYGEDLCTTRCLPAPYCGDHQVDVDHNEDCDDGVNSGQPGSCQSDCTGWVPYPNCGDGAPNNGEECDVGSASCAASSSCTCQCKYRCGNGAVDANEDCDDGVNDGSYGGCNDDCSFAGYCGDEIKNGPELCDLGDQNQASPYGPNKCSTECLNAPFCGDGRIQTSQLEECDGQPGCANNCKWKILK